MLYYCGLCIQECSALVFFFLMFLQMSFLGVTEGGKKAYSVKTFLCSTPYGV